MRVVRLRDVRRAAKKTCLTRAGLTGLTGAGLIGAGAHAQGRFVERPHALGRSVHPYGMQGRVRRFVERAVHPVGMHALQSNASPRAFRRTGSAFRASLRDARTGSAFRRTGRGPRPRAFR